MSDIYLNSTSLKELNELVKDYVTTNLLPATYISNEENVVTVTTRLLAAGFYIFLIRIAYKYIVSYILPLNDPQIKGKLNLKPVRFNTYIPEPAMKNWKGKRLVSPVLDHPSQPGIIQSFCPSTGQHLSSFPSKTIKDFNQILKQARDCQSKWAYSTLERRLKVLISLKSYILDNQEIIARIACRDTGKTFLDASSTEIIASLDKLKWAINNSSTILQERINKSKTSFITKYYTQTEIINEPVGVVLAITDWNYPFYNILTTLIDCLITGNSLIIYCSEYVIWSSEYFVQLIKNCLEACNEDINMIQLFYCLPTDFDTDSKKNTQEVVISNPNLNFIKFIGKREMAKSVALRASVSLTPFSLKIGKKNSLILLEYSNMHYISSVIMSGAFQASGGNYFGINRVVIVKDSYQKLIDTLDTRLKTHPLRLGSDMDHLEDIDIGALISNKTFDQLEELILDAISSGAKLLTGGTRYIHPNFPQGNYFQPTVLIDVKPEMKISTMELFAPILLIMEANDHEQCIKIINNMPYLSGVSIFGTDNGKCENVTKALTSKNISINNISNFSIGNLNFGLSNNLNLCNIEYKKSALEISTTRNISYSFTPKFSTHFFSSLDYPVTQHNIAWFSLRNFIVFCYSTSTWKKTKAFYSLLKISRKYKENK